MPKPATSHDGKNSRDENDVNEHTASEEERDENKKPRTADRQDNPSGDNTFLTRKIVQTTTPMKIWTQEIWG